MNLFRLLDEVERGQTFIVTRYGKPIARLSPYEEQKQLDVPTGRDEERER